MATPTTTSTNATAQPIPSRPPAATMPVRLDPDDASFDDTLEPPPCYRERWSNPPPLPPAMPPPLPAARMAAMAAPMRSFSSSSLPDSTHSSTTPPANGSSLPLPIRRANWASRSLAVLVVLLLTADLAQIVDMVRHDVSHTPFGIAAVGATIFAAACHLYGLAGPLRKLVGHGVSARSHRLASVLWPFLFVLCLTGVVTGLVALHASLAMETHWYWASPVVHVPAIVLAVRAVVALKTVETRVARADKANAPSNVPLRAVMSPPPASACLPGLPSPAHSSASLASSSAASLNGLGQPTTKPPSPSQQQHRFVPGGAGPASLRPS
ncbi:hypothetical protein AMAG_00199 [Allomyces macrogynus ATCC 38327]|uniref:Uncharacterized protein n=1 Tax=Allomyces macrogynus (strain ATCC 38327) TaxID=578462 RepID=A0A0L0RVU1_ALLM3|nr:hypothetical protein AMAG_00199 [Allomyces macrogynus ATCC 38327]|eukprot:KNE54206.1 hypothetical protein AMAG_00199 [Allomyces macrogynus ATCC 38327]